MVRSLYDVRGYDFMLECVGYGVLPLSVLVMCGLSNSIEHIMYFLLEEVSGLVISVKSMRVTAFFLNCNVGYVTW